MLASIEHRFQMSTTCRLPSDLLVAHHQMTAMATRPFYPPFLYPRCVQPQNDLRVGPRSPQSFQHGCIQRLHTSRVRLLALADVMMPWLNDSATGAPSGDEVTSALSAKRADLAAIRSLTLI